MLKNSVSIIVPAHNEGRVILDLLKSVEEQDGVSQVKKIYIISSSTDDTNKHVSEYKGILSNKIDLIKTNKKSLASKENLGISKVRTKYFILMHADSILVTHDAIKRFLDPFEKDHNLVEVTSYVRFTHKNWKNFPFWEKTTYSRYVDTTGPSNIGKGNCFDLGRLVKQVGVFDEKFAFPIGSEDYDLEHRIRLSGLKIIADKKIIIEHRHPAIINDTIHYYINREAILGESFGKLLSKFGLGIFTPKSFMLTFFRPILVIALFIPIVNTVSAVLIIIYSFLYTKRMIVENPKDIRVYSLPAVNIFLLLVQTVSSAKGVLNYHYMNFRTKSEK